MDSGAFQRLIKKIPSIEGILILSAFQLSAELKIAFDISSAM